MKYFVLIALFVQQISWSCSYPARFKYHLSEDDLKMIYNEVERLNLLSAFDVEEIHSSNEDIFGELGHKYASLILAPIEQHKQLQVQWTIECNTLKEGLWSCISQQNSYISLAPDTDKNIQVFSDDELNLQELLDAAKYASYQKPVSWEQNLSAIFYLEGKGYNAIFDSPNSSRRSLFIKTQQEKGETLFYINWDYVKPYLSISSSCNGDRKDTYLTYKKAPNETDGALNEK